MGDSTFETSGGPYPRGEVTWSSVTGSAAILRPECEHADAEHDDDPWVRLAAAEAEVSRLRAAVAPVEPTGGTVLDVATFVIRVRRIDREGTPGHSLWHRIVSCDVPRMMRIPGVAELVEEAERDV